jgi:hypothetical protein
MYMSYPVEQQSPEYFVEQVVYPSHPMQADVGRQAFRLQVRSGCDGFSNFFGIAASYSL